MLNIENLTVWNFTVTVDGELVWYEYLLLYLGVLRDGGLEGEDGETSSYELTILAP